MAENALNITISMKDFPEVVGAIRAELASMIRTLVAERRMSNVELMAIADKLEAKR